MAQTATAHVEQVSTPYYRKPYDKKAEHRRGYWLLGIFAFLSVATLFLWIWHHMPDLFCAVETQWVWEEYEGMRDYLDWFLASLIGVLVYVMANVGQFLPKIAKEEANFRAYTGWYMSTIIRGIIIAQVVMWLLINLELKVSGDAIALSFGAMPPIVLTGAAFILGYYSRVARAQLDEITRMLFSKAWLLAKERFVVLPSAGKIIFEKQLQLKTDPTTDVTWTADQGTIDGTGLYTAPKQSDSAKPGTRVLIRAALKTDPAISAVATITLVPFELIAAKNEMAYDSSQEMTIDSSPPEGVELGADYGTVDGLKYTAPSEAVAKENGLSEIVLTAKRKLKEGESEADRELDKDSITIKLKAQK